MIKVTLQEAEGHLGKLIEEAAAGEEVVILSDGGAAVRLSLLPRNEDDQRAGEPAKAVGPALDQYIGTWSAEQEAEVLQAVQLFEQVDPSFWQ
jgi:antitoxin (DNA-binding transcriptional repressor) of toxin-antitoxin stability system